MDGDHTLSRAVRAKLTKWKAKAGSIGRWCGRKNFLRRTRSNARKVVAPIDSSLVPRVNNELDNKCGRVFHPFSRLPIELRLEIWRMSWGSRNIGIVTKFIYCQDSDYNMNLDVTELKTSTSPPSTVSVNRESRAETLLHYRRLALGPLTHRYVVSEFYFNYELDTIAIYIVTVTGTPGELHRTDVGFVSHFLDTATALRGIRSLIMIPVNEYGYYIISFGDHEIHTNHQSAYSYLSELILLADSSLEGVAYDDYAPNVPNDLTPIGYTPIISSHSSPPGHLSVIPDVLAIPDYVQNEKASYGIFR
ncbi:hypothetical protein BTUL_0026g00520 [Botrytis tulipae]|uniref:2EXR domain-containing protein n=1 Tax=Botrytis tulipae TaxID=87230 RepID=A0A4Z1EZD1_9HELO|nr:hypothetical protein BTUL_0026g00520 [Botrytis tulipae]